jgi:hypothetical protein
LQISACLHHADRQDGKHPSKPPALFLNGVISATHGVNSTSILDIVELLAAQDD